MATRSPARCALSIPTQGLPSMEASGPPDHLLRAVERPCRRGCCSSSPAFEGQQVAPLSDQGSSKYPSLTLKEGDTFLDIGCGVGEYSLHASELVGVSGRVYALDKSESILAEFTQQVLDSKISNIITLVADATKPLPIQDGSVDLCLVATVLHVPEVARQIQALGKEIHRVLKPGGRLAVIECSLKDLSFGPPPHMRLSPVTLGSMITPLNFDKLDEIDLGFNYLMQFIARDSAMGF